jgi:hypothetical protein
LTAAARDGDENMRSGWKNARGGGIAVDTMITVNGIFD